MLLSAKINHYRETQPWFVNESLWTIEKVIHTIFVNYDLNFSLFLT